MKIMIAIIRLIALYSFLIVAPSATSGQNASSAPMLTPNYLPVKDLQTVREWAVTNEQFRQFVGFDLNYQDAVSGEWYSEGWPYQAVRFHSYADYEDFMVEHCMNILSDIRTQKNVGPEIDLWAMVDAWEPIPPTIMIEAFFMQINEITADSFRNLPPKFIQAWVSVPGLQKFEVTLDGVDQHPTLYPQFPGFILIEQQFLFATNNWVFKITANDQTATYDKYGSLIIPTISLIINRSNSTLTVSLPEDIGVLIESSPDLKTWSAVTEIPPASKPNFTSIEISATKASRLPAQQAMQFYRATPH